MEAYRPLNINEALAVRSEKDVYVLNGGTDLMVKKKNEEGLIPKFDKAVMFISQISELKKIYKDEKYIHIGSGCTFSEIIKNDVINELLKEPSINIASPAIRNAATIGGNICNSSPAADILPALYSLEAKLQLQSIKSQRLIDIQDFITGPSRNILSKDELLTEILIPAYDFNKSLYKKVGTRKSTAISKLSFMGLAKVENGKAADIRMSFGAVGPTIVKSKAIENEIEGKSPEEILSNLESIKEQYSRIINPIDDQRSTAKYRKRVCLNLVSCFLEQLKDKSGEWRVEN